MGKKPDRSPLMANDTITLALQGDVSLDQFADAIQHLSGLVIGLSTDARVPDIRWEINDLEVGSTIATARGLPNGRRPNEIEEVVRSYLEVGRALEGGQTIPYSQRVREKAHAITRVLSRGVEAIRFETAEADAIIRRSPEAKEAVSRVPAERRAAYGAVTGRVHTLTSRNRLRFVLYDTLYDRPVSCYIAEGSEAQARDIWDSMATVEGWVSRDPDTGRPLSVRQITRISPLSEGDVRGYLRARAARPRRRGEATAEERIRRLRDAE